MMSSEAMIATRSAISNPLPDLGQDLELII